jgi:hypothetical protein
MSNTLQKQLLLDGAKIIEDPSRWTGGALKRRKKVCAVGAMYLVGKQLRLTPKEVNHILGDSRRDDIIRINDREGREAVIAHMRELAAQL